MLLAFFSWWYGQGWRQVASSLKSRVQAISDSFSVRQLSRTLFAPWKRIISPGGRSLDAKMRALADNLFSRVIGFIVRIFVLSGAAISVLVIAVLTVIEVVAWPLAPFAIPALVILGLLA